jgi:hypothetical protein
MENYRTGMVESVNNNTLPDKVRAPGAMISSCHSGICQNEVDLFTGLGQTATHVPSNCPGAHYRYLHGAEYSVLDLRKERRFIPDSYTVAVGIMDVDCRAP